MKMTRRKLFAGLAALLAAVVAGAGITTASVNSADVLRGDSCCCVERDGRLICTITGEALDKCCCR